MIYYVSSTGQVIGGTAGSDLTGITHLPANSDYAIYVDDATVSSLNASNAPGTYSFTSVVEGPVYSVPTATGTLTFTEQPASEQLANAQTSKQTFLDGALSKTIASGFPSSADGTERTYAIDPVAMGKWTGTLANINDGMITSNIVVKDISGNKVTLTTSQYKQFALDGFNYFNAQEQKLWIKEDQVDACKTLADVNTIGWPNPNPPSVPTGLTGTAGTNQVVLSWAANTDVTMVGGGGYNVYQNSVKINSSLVTGTTFTASSLTAGTAYTFAITAVDTDGNESTKSASINVTSN